MPLLNSGAGRSIGLSPSGESLAMIAARIEAESRAVASVQSQHSGTATGKIRLTATPFMVNRLIAPALSAFSAAHPGLRLVLLPDGRDYALEQHEADLALRPARPEQGGQAVTARRIGRLFYGAVAPAEAAPDALGWIGIDESLAHLTHARWLAAQSPQTAVTVSDHETARAAIAAGLGKSLLPCLPGTDPRLAPVPAETLPSRDIWLMRRRADARDPATRAVADWLAALCSTLPRAPAQPCPAPQPSDCISLSRLAVRSNSNVPSPST